MGEKGGASRPPRRRRHRPLVAVAPDAADAAVDALIAAGRAASLRCKLAHLLKHRRRRQQQRSGADGGSGSGSGSGATHILVTHWAVGRRWVGDGALLIIPGPPRAEREGGGGTWISFLVPLEPHESATRNGADPIRRDARVAGSLP